MKASFVIASLRRTALPLFLAFACMSISEAKTFTFDQENFQCDAPDDWHVSQDKNVVFFSQGPAPDYPSVMMTRVPDDPLVEIYSPFCYNTLETNLRDHGLRIASHRFVMANGYQTLEINSFLARPDGSVENESRQFIAADGYLYSISLLAINTDPTANPQLVAARDSFRFLTPPLIPRERSLGFSFFHASNADNLPDSQFSVGRVGIFLFQIISVGMIYSPFFLLLWCGMLLHFYLTRARYRPVTSPPAQPSPGAFAPASATASIPAVNRTPPPRRKMGLLPAPRQLSKRPDQK
jgi:hypothetical protein